MTSIIVATKNPEDILGVLAVFIIGFLLSYLSLIDIMNTEYKLKNIYLLVGPVVAGSLSTLVYIKYGVTAQMILYFVGVIVLVTISILDFQHKVILDRLNLIILLVGILYMLMESTYKDSLLGFVIYGVGALLLAVVSNGGLGGGDVKLMGGLGLIFGVLGTYQVLMWMGIYAGVYIVMDSIKNKKINLKNSIALGPFISMGAITCMLTG